MPNVYFIFAGSQQHMMNEMFISAKRPFFQSSQIINLGEIEETAYYEFSARLFERQEMSLSAPVFHYMYEKLDGQTWYLQAIMNRIYANHAVDVIGQAEVDQAIEELIDENETAFENYYSSLTNNQCALLLAIARERQVKAPMANEFKKKYRLPALSSIKTALTALTDQQLIYQYHGSYIVYDRFFGMWLRQRVTV